MIFADVFALMSELMPEMLLHHVVTLLVLLPLGGAILSAMWPTLGRRVSIVALSFCVVISLSLLSTLYVDKTWLNSGYRLVMGGWQTGLGIALRFDPLAGLFLLMSASVGIFVSLHAHRFFKEAAAHAVFWPLWLMLFSALHGLFLGADLFNLYVTLELMGISAVSLCLLTNRQHALQAAAGYLVFGLLGSMLFLAGIVLVYISTGSLDLAQAAASLDEQTVILAFYLAATLITLGLLFKTAIYPFQFWLPPAHSNALAPVSAVLSALVVKAAFYLLLRLWLELFDPLLTQAVSYLLGSLGAAAVLWGGYQAIVADRLKRLAACSTVAQIGYLFLFFPLLARVEDEAARLSLVAVLCLMALSHAFAKAALFLAAGSVLQQQGHDRIRELQGLARFMPITSFVIALSGIALIGLPPSGGFIAKWQLMTALIDFQLVPWLIVVLIGTLLACAYIFRLLGYLFSDSRLPLGPARHRLSREKVRPWSAMGMALIATLVLGLAAQPIWLLLAPMNGGG